MFSGAWLSLALALWPLGDSAPRPAQTSPCPATCQPRDPIVYDPTAFDAFLTQMSTAPDVRISISSGRMEYLTAYARTPRAATKLVRLGRRAGTNRSQRGKLSAAQMANRSMIYATALSHSLDPGYFLALAGRESRFDHLARAPSSSASGLFQFTENTWLCVLHRYGKAAGIAEASAIFRSSNGRCRTSSPLTRWQLLALRYDAELNARMAALHTKDNTQDLLRILGRVPDAAELYAFHFFGADEGSRFLSASPSATAAAVTPRAARSNRTLFYDRDGRPLSVFEIRDHMRETFNGV